LRVVFYGDVAGEGGAVDENIVVAELAVVADVRVRHDEIVAAEPRGAAAFYRAAIHRGKFAKGVVVADFDSYALPGEGEVLRIAADNREGVHAIILAEARRALHDGVMIEDAAIAKLDFVANDGVGADANIRANARPRRNDGLGMKFAHDYFCSTVAAGAAEADISRSTILHISVASAASSPLTEARPESLQKSPRKASTTTSTIS
jgi:hypothetical protein